MSVQYSTDGPVAIVTIDRPERRNAVDRPTADALVEAFRSFDDDNALAFGLANRVVPDGSACASAVALAREIAAFPQVCLRGDRQSALEQWDLTEAEAIRNEMRRGMATIASGETMSGASAFSAGSGRHGSAVRAGTTPDS